MAPRSTASHVAHFVKGPYLRVREGHGVLGVPGLRGGHLRVHHRGRHCRFTLVPECVLTEDKI